jgi:hypothetical protein
MKGQAERSSDAPVAMISCDESGSEGENLMSAAQPVFVHGSVNLSPDEAEEIMLELRARTRVRAAELKSTVALSTRNRPALLSAIASIAGRGNINLVDKAYYTTVKLIELTIAEHPRELDFL